ncbi:MAG TPA: AAA family ATPase [Candidatus Nanoarchaeia archaeon]|nr:AAA family ATPase [Candidatus Nanoarchaeia archaeon]
MIIGITGPIAAGKSVVAAYLRTKGFEGYVYSDILRTEAKRWNIEETRENLQKLGNRLKQRSGNPAILSKKLLALIHSGRTVVDGIRTVDEIQELRKGKDVLIWGIVAPPRIRFRRLFLRKREGDPKSYSQFKHIDNAENRGKTKGQNINACLQAVDALIDNRGTIEELYHEVDSLLSSLK